MQEAKLTKEEIERFEKGELSFESLSKEKREQLELVIAGEPVEIEGVEAADQTAAVAPAGETNKPDKSYVPGEEYKKKADEANTFKQRAESLRLKLEDAAKEVELLKARQQELPTAAGVGTGDLLNRIQGLEKLVLEGNKKAIEKQETLVKELETKMSFAEIDALAQEYPELDLGTTFEKANEQYAEFYTKLGGKAELVDKYLEDQAFRTEMESKGIKIPKNFEKLQVALTVYGNRSKYPSVEEAYLGYLHKQGKLKERFSSAYSDGVRDAVKKIAENRNETTIMAPSGGGGGSEMSEDQMMDWLSKHPHPKTADERAVMSRIQTYLAKASGSEE